MCAPTSEQARRILRSAPLVVALLGPACSLTRPEFGDCSSSADCRGAFGLGWVCNGDGLCEAAQPEPRCNASFPDDLLSRPENHAGTIVVGSLMDRSVAAQQAREAAIRLAVSQVDDAGGLGDRSFGVVFCDIAKNAQYDSLDRTAAAQRAASWLAEVMGVPAIVGPSASGDVLAVFDRVRSEQVLLISPSATSPALTSADVQNPTEENPGLLWRTAPPDTIQGLAIAGYLMSLTPVVTSVEVIAEKGAYGDGLAAVFMSAFGGPANLSVFTNPSERDAAALAAGNGPSPWVLFISSQTPDASAFLAAAVKSAGYASKNVFLTDAAANSEVFVDAASAAALFPRVRGSRPSVPQGPTYELFRASFSAAYKLEANSYGYVAHAYDAAWLSFAGAAWSLGREGHIRGQRMAQAMRHVSLGPSVTIEPKSWGALAGELGKGGSVNVIGASGALDYGPDEETRGPIDIWKVAPDNQTIEIETTLMP